MESLRRRIEDLFVGRMVKVGLYPWDIQNLIDRILVEFENEIAERKAQEATADERDQEPELPL